MASATIGTLAIRLAALTAEFNREIQKSARKVSSISVAAQKVAKVSAGAFAGLTGSIALVTKVASEQIKVERQLAAAFKATGKSVNIDSFKEFASGLQAVTTTGDEVILGMGAMLAATGLAQGQIEAILPGVLDLAAASGKSAQSIGEKLSRAIQTGTADLNDYGLFMTKAEKETFAMGSAAERTAFIVSKMGAFQGAAAAEASTAAGRFSQLTNSFGDLLEEAGKIVDAPLATMFDGLRDAVDGVVGAMSRLSPETKAWAANVALGGTAVVGLVGALASVIAFKVPLLAMFAAVKAAMAVTFTGILPVIAAVAVAIVGIIAAVGALRLAWDQNSVAIKDTFKRLGQSLVDIWDKAIGFLRDTFRRFNDWFSEKAIIVVGLMQGMSADEIGQMTMTARAGGGLLNTGEGSGARDLFAGVGDAIASSVKEFNLKPLKQSWDAGIKTFKELGGAAFGAAKGLFGVEDAATAASGGIVGGGGLGAPSPLAVSNRLDARLGGRASGSGLSPRVGASGAVDPTRVAAVALKETAERFGITISTELAGAAVQLGSSLKEGAATFGSMFGNSMLSAAGDIGELANSAIQGFQAGGPIGAIAAVFADLISRSQAFKDTMAAGNEAIGELVAAFEPLAEAMKPLAGLVHNVIGIVADMVGPVFEALGPVFIGVFHVVRGVLIGVLNVIMGFGQLWNWIVQGLESIIDAIPGVDVELSSWEINLNGINRAIRKLHDTTEESTRADIDGPPPPKDPPPKEGPGPADLNEQLSNVPTGFKIDLRRYQASTGETLAPDVAGGGGATFVFNVHDAEELWRRLNRIDEFKSLAQGSLGTKRRPFAVPREGG